MKRDIRVGRQPGIIFLVDAIVVQNHMDFLTIRQLSYDMIHELEKLDASFFLSGFCVNGSSSNFQRGKQIQCAVTLVSAFEAANDFSIVRFHVPGAALQSLNAWFFVDRNHQSILGRIQVQTDNIGGLGSKRRIRAHTPTPLPTQTDAFLTEDPPDGMNRGVQLFCDSGAIPMGLSLRRRLFKQLHHLLAKIRTILNWLPRTSTVQQTCRTLSLEARSPVCVETTFTSRKEPFMTPLRQRMIEDMGVRNLAEGTQKVYVDRVAQFAKHFGKSPELLGPEDIRSYQVYLVQQKKVSWSVLNLSVCALRFLYRITL